MKPVSLRQFLGEGVWVVAGQTLAALGTIVGLRLLTSALPPSVFGELILLNGIILLGNGLSGGPLMQGVLRLYPEAAKLNAVDQLRAIAASYQLRLTTLTSVICLVCFLIYSIMVPVSRWLGIFIVCLLVADVRRQLEMTLLSAGRHQRTLAIWSVIDAWVRPSAAYSLVIILGANSFAALLGYVVASWTILGMLIYWRPEKGSAARTLMTRLPDGTEALSQSLVIYALPLMPLGIVGWITSQADRYLLGVLVGVEQAGLYAALYAVVSRPFLMAGTMLESWMRPIYYEAIVASEVKMEKHLLQIWMSAVTGIGILGIAIFFLWPHQIAKLLLAEPYRHNADLMSWMAIGYAILLLAQVYGTVCYAHKDTKAVLYSESLGCLVAVTTTIYAVNRYGATGAAFALPVYFSAQLVMSMIMARRAEAHRPMVLLSEGRSSVSTTSA